MSEAKPDIVEAARGRLEVDAEICIGCRACEAACSLTHEGYVAPSLSRIRVKRNPLDGPDFTPQQCHQCVEPGCMAACPVGAISLDVDSAYAVVVDTEACTGCGSCVDACLYDPPRIMFDEARGIAYKCDLCGGRPACVESCPTGAIVYIQGGHTWIGDDPEEFK